MDKCKVIFSRLFVWISAFLVTVSPVNDVSALPPPVAAAPVSPPQVTAAITASAPTTLTAPRTEPVTPAGETAPPRGDGGATYSREVLLQLRSLATRPPTTLVERLKCLKLLKRRRGVRGGRKARRPVRVVVGNRQPLSEPTTPARSSVLSRPPRLTAAQTNAAATPERAAERKPMKIGHLNVRSLTGKLEEINALLLSENLDILCLSETFLTPDVLTDFLVFSGYKICRADRRRPRKGRQVVRGGGVAILYRDHLKVEMMNLENTDPAVDSLWISVSHRGRPAVVGAIYRPPDSAISSFLDSLHGQLQMALSRGKPLFLLGDVNINVSDREASSVRRYLQLLTELGLHQLVSEPTHLSPRPTTLDHIVTNHANLSDSVKVLADSPSDHQPVVCSVPLPKIRPTPVFREIRRWERADWDSICLDLLLADWKPMYEAPDVDGKLCEFMRTWDDVIDRHCPVVRVRSGRSGSCPWIREDPELCELMSLRDRARDEWLNVRSDNARDVYRRLRNDVKSRLVRARKEFLCNQLAAKDYRGFWTRFNSFAKNASAGGNTTAMPSALDAEQADKFNDYFAGVGAKIASELQLDDPTKLTDDRPPMVCAARFSLTPATLPELSRAVRSMSNSRAVGIDGVPILAVRRCFDVIGPLLLHLINKSIVAGVFPERWKIACVVPVHKAGDRGEASNYRPISLLPVMSKIAERVVCTQLSRYLFDNHLLSACQYAYRRGHSTEDAVIDAVSWAVNKIDSGELVSITTLDLSKAFDSVDHGVLLKKLEWMGVSSHWFQSYLSDRGQVVRGGSRICSVNFGVPQGSIVGPILFSAFVADLQGHLPHGRMICYADDTQLLDSSPPDRESMSKLKIRIQESMASVHNWFKDNSLKMNASKTDFILLGTKKSLQTNADFTFTFSDNIFQSSKTIKLLGVTVDQSLTWDQHISSVVRRCYCILISLNRFRRHFTTEALITIIQAHVFSQIIYCLPVWGGAAEKELQRIQKIINFAARIVTGAKRHDHITPSLNSLHWSRIGELVEERDCLKVYRALHDNHAPTAMQGLFTRRCEVATRDTRLSSTERVHLPRVQLTATQKHFMYRAGSAWNRLPDDVLAKSGSLHAFKQAVQQRRRLQ